MTEVTLRSASPQDDALRCQLFVQHQLDPALAAIGDASLLQMQWQARQRSYDSQYPSAVTSIIEESGRPVGALTVDRSGDTIRLVDIVVSADTQGRGVGSQLIRELQREATAANRTVVLSVAVENARARALYERLGFALASADAVYVEMCWPALS